MEAWPHEGFTAGLGWNVSLGRVLPPVSEHNDSNNWIYVSPDGANHSFYATLHDGDPADAALYTRDSSYIRMKVAGTNRIVEFGDGTRHTFEEDPSGDFYRPTALTNRFGDVVTISFTADSWTISDPHGRTQTVTFTELDATDDWEPKVVSEIRLESFDGGDAVYTFSYTSVELVQACPHNADDIDPLNVPLLSEVTLPDGSKYSMPDYVVPSTSLLCATQPGRIEALELPTGGRIQWTYQSYQFPRPMGPFSPPPGATKALETSIGVATRTFVNADGTVHGTWQYETSLTPNPDAQGPGFPQPNELVNTVIDPFGNKTVHYFTVDMEGGDYTGDWSVYDYGLPFTRDPDTIFPGQSPGPEDDLFLSTRTLDANDSPVRSTCRLCRPPPAAAPALSRPSTDSTTNTSPASCEARTTSRSATAAATAATSCAWWISTSIPERASSAPPATLPA